jgi:hypothetical protein
MCLALMPGSTIFRTALAACTAVLLAVPGTMAAAPVQSDDIAELSLEELANIKVTSASRRADSLSDAAPSIVVIAGNDIRRSRRNHRDAPTRPARPRQANNRQGCDHSGFRAQRTRHHP